MKMDGAGKIQQPLIKNVSSYFFSVTYTYNQSNGILRIYAGDEVEVK